MNDETRKRVEEWTPIIVVVVLALITVAVGAFKGVIK